VAAHPDETFVIVERAAGSGKKLILAQARVAAVFGDEVVRVYESFKGTHLKGLRYRPLFTFLLPEKTAYIVVMDETASAAQGSGLVPLSPACEPHAWQVAGTHGLPVFEILAADGTLGAEVWPWRGLHFQAAGPLIAQDLEARGLVYRQETLTRPLPCCLYCDTPLHYRSGRGWYVRAANHSIGTLGHLAMPAAENDWLASRERGWGAALPIWECGECAARHVPASLDELAQWAGGPLKLPDLHPLSLDRLQLACPACGGPMQRAAGVLDEWFELGVLPFYLNTGQAADFLSVGRHPGSLWLRALYTLGVQLTGQECARQFIYSVLHESTGEPATDLLETLRKDGADALRWSVYTMHGRDSNEGEPDEAWASTDVLQVLREAQVWLAAEAAKPAAKAPPSPLDRWLLSRLQSLAEAMTERMERGNVNGAAEACGRFVIEDLDGWYLRLARPAAGLPPPALRPVCAALSALLAPFAPFLAEDLFQKLVRFETVDAPASVMLAEWPRRLGARPCPGGRDDPGPPAGRPGRAGARRGKHLPAPAAGAGPAGCARRGATGRRTR
jgi:isoleucyl-tRNA synthetase